MNSSLQFLHLYVFSTTPACNSYQEVHDFKFSAAHTETGKMLKIKLHCELNK